MQAIVNHRAGDPRQLYIVERPTPVILPNQVLIHVKAASVNIADTQEFQDYYQKKHVPTKTKLLDRAYVHSENKVLGADGAGIIVAVGSKIKDFQLGDEVIFIADDYLHGAWAEYIAVSRKNIVLKPQNLSFTAAAALPTTAGTALAALKKAQLKVGQKVLINGASGGVGLFALQIAKAYGASVSAVVSSYNFDLVKKFGAKEVYDYHTTDITRKARTKFNVIIGVNGYHSVQDYKKILSFDGRYVAVGGVK
ncbi:hypothetical protein LFYK43_19890 [Ligilactobacillus salitolerans]|uniref:Enoyl reductase (ER) domain-containing protein n=1 Tax=Ligilactobacillus salitolerans TaxID=1808352 RepID=A0A401IVF0_9LACO|nr:NAD(P)-dependent alcohol dehydrogenase [Ligilactobacillus salitolerans]GBG95530.1 hypothetical protein LFYK43_19890 [Ligilactobacillus salitolerans]